MADRARLRQRHLALRGDDSAVYQVRPDAKEHAGRSMTPVQRAIVGR